MITFYTVVLSCLLLTAANAQQRPAAATENWLQEASLRIEEMEYNFRSQDASLNTYTTANKPNRLVFAGISPFGYKVIGSCKKEKTGLPLASFHVRKIAGMDVSAIPASAFVTAKNKMSLVFRSPVFDVEYINDKTGMRQNFVVKQKPADNNTLSVVMEVSSDLTARLEAADRFVLRNGAKAELIYDGLKVFDATGKILPASMSLNNDGSLLTIKADDRNAVYPVTVDPLNRTPEWSTSADGVLPGLLNNLQLQVQTLYGYTVAGLGDVNGDGNPNSDRAGLLGRGTLHGPAYCSVDVGAAWRIPIAGRVHGDIRVDAFNLFNRTNVRDLNTVWGSDDLTRQPDDLLRFGSPRDVFNPRQIQLGLRIEF